MASKESDRVGNVSPLPFTWIEKYSDTLDTVWDKLPGFLRSTLATVAIFILGLSINGEWITIGVHIAKQLGYLVTNTTNTKPFSWSEISAESLYLQNWPYFMFGSVTISFAIYLGMGGFLHWYFYVRQRDRPEEWKLQPKRFMTPELERHCIIVGCTNLLIVSMATGVIASYIANGGVNKIYYTFNADYPWWWFFLQIPILFFMQDYAIYWIHRFYHIPFFYKNFHKVHHRYPNPTAFSVVAIHPVESLHIQLSVLLPMFFIPLHWFSLCLVAMYSYYHGIIDHSGINFKSYWWQPWQPDAIFHDNHHQYFHVNFAFNCGLWDKIHGTERRKNRVYTEDYYNGKDISEATPEEIKADMEERLAENPSAYRSNELVYSLTEDHLSLINNNNEKKCN